jgi:hypothetical protein
MTRIPLAVPAALAMLLAVPANEPPGGGYQAPRPAAQPSTPWTAPERPESGPAERPPRLRPEEDGDPRPGEATGPTPDELAPGRSDEPIRRPREDDRRAGG